MIRMESSKALYRELISCNRCGAKKYGKEPFCFPIKGQKVMLITACPSIQAMYRPLTSIRFFRSMCIALFGPEISEKFLQAMHDDIYWTHLHKCYFEEAFIRKDFSVLPNHCAETFLDEEVRLLKPKLIIILGRTIAERLLVGEGGDLAALPDDFSDKCISARKWGYEVLATDFPSHGLEPRFLDLRRKMNEIPGFSWISTDTRLPVTKKKSRQDSGLAVGIDFEEHFLLGKPLDRRNSADGFDIDYEWATRLVLPGRERAQRAMQMVFFIEDQFRTFCMSIYSQKHYHGLIASRVRIDRRMDRQPTQTEIYEYLKDHWLESFRAFLQYLLEDRMEDLRMPDDRKLEMGDVDSLILKIEALKKVRNALVHNGGYRPATYYKENITAKINGVENYVNMVYISKVGDKEVVRLKDDCFSILRAACKWADTHPHVSSRPELALDKAWE